MKLIRKIAVTGLLVVGMAAFSTKADERSADGASFDGKVSSVDKSAQTLVVDGKTYQLLPTSQITREKNAAGANDLAAGQQVSGRYKKSDEGKMEVLSVNITQASTETASARSDNASSAGGASFDGKISKVDRSEKTITVGSQTIHVLPTSRITGRNGQSLDFGDVRTGRQVNGQYKKSADNRLELLSMQVTGQGNATGGAEDRATSEAGASFSGRIDSVDASGQTVRIGKRTFHVLPTTAIMGASGNPATLANLKQDQQVSGTYKKSAEGKLELLTLRVGNAK